MPYSITTKDGITIDNIPDNVPSDAATLKERVAQLRAAKGSAPPAPTSQPEPATVSQDKTSAWDAIKTGFRDPLDGIAQIGVHAAEYLPANYLLKKFAPNNPVSKAIETSKGVVDKDIAERNKTYEEQRGPDAGFDWLRLAGNVVNPVNLIPTLGVAKGVNAAKVAATTGANALKESLPSLFTSGAKSGALGGALQPVTDTSNGDFGSQKAAQVGLGAAGGAIVTPAVTRVAEAAAPKVASTIAAVKNKINPQPAPNIDVATTNVFKAQGINPADLNEAMRQSVRAQVEAAINSKSKIDPSAFIRKAQFEAVGLKDEAGPTLGQMTRDPMQYAEEKRLSGINMDGGNPLNERLKLQNQKLTGVFDEFGANNATDRVTAGQTILNALRDADKPVKQGVDDLYEAARGMTNGRMADLDRAHFSNTANEALDKGMYNAYVPSNVRNMLNDITAGKGPFNVESAVQIDSLLSKAQRQAERSGDDAGASSIGVIRNALHDTPMMPTSKTATVPEAAMNASAGDAARTVDEGITDVPFNDIGRTQIGGNGTAVSIPEQPTYSQVNNAVGPALPPQIDEGQAARDAFDQARQAARKRFSTIEDTPALKAALDDAAPDKFVQKFIIGADVRDVDAINKVLSDNPQARAQARAQVADYLKKAAFGQNVSGDKEFKANTFVETLAALGPEKLKLFFTPDEIVKMNLAGKVASDISSIPAASRVNHSNTTSSAINAVMGILNKIPGGAILGVPLNFGRRELGDYQTQKAIGQALNPQIANEASQLSPEMMRRLQLLGIGSGMATGVEVGSSVGQ